MALLDWLAGFAFGGLYGAVILAVALIGAIPYGAWQGLKRVRALISRRTHGNS